MARLLLTYEQQFPAGKKGQKRGRMDLTTFESTHGASTQSKDRVKAKLFDYPEFAIYFKTKKGYSDADCLQMWRDFEMNPQVPKSYGGRKDFPLQMYIPVGASAMVDRSSFHTREVHNTRQVGRAISQDDQQRLMEETHQEHLNIHDRFWDSHSGARALIGEFQQHNEWSTSAGPGTMGLVWQLDGEGSHGLGRDLRVPSAVQGGAEPRFQALRDDVSETSLGRSQPSASVNQALDLSGACL